MECKFNGLKLSRATDEMRDNVLEMIENLKILKFTILNLSRRKAH